MLDVISRPLTSTPPIGETSRLIATLPSRVTGLHLREVRRSSKLPIAKFAALLGVSIEWLRVFERGSPAVLSLCRPWTQAGVAKAMLKLGIRLTNEGWELLPNDGDGDTDG